MTEKRESLSDLRKRADDILSADHAERRGTAQLLRDLIVLLDDQDKKAGDHLLTQERRRLGLIP